MAIDSNNGPERSILVGLEMSPGKIIDGKSEGERSLDELERLACTAGAVVMDKVLQRRSVKDAACYIGRGKTEELKQLCCNLNADTVVFDDELSGAQVRNIEKILDVKVIDRTMLILDIFAQRAHSKEGKLQVELAQLNYRLPRLTGLGTRLSRLGGGIGTRGPGERKLDIDKRHIRRRIGFLMTELGNLGKRRGLLRKSRKKNMIPVLAIVGYTNAGKSTLMNRLCNTDVFAEDKLFATLDPTTRKLALPDGRDVLLVDTVGFIRKLPHELVEAFKSTLEESVYADALIHVADVSSEEIESQINVVNGILHELGALNKPVILVLNKVDMAGGETRIPVEFHGINTFETSAVTGLGLDRLVEGIARILPANEVEIDILVPYSEGWILSYIHDNGRILFQDFTEVGTRVKALIGKSKAGEIMEYAL